MAWFSVKIKLHVFINTTWFYYKCIHWGIASSYIICTLPDTVVIILWKEHIKSVFDYFKVHSTGIKTQCSY